MKVELVLLLLIVVAAAAGGYLILKNPIKTSGMPFAAGALKEKYREIVAPSGFVNTPINSGQAAPITIGELVGKKVILIDFLTYSCINCQRTFPHINRWYEKYKDQGLEIIGIHTPEFAFEKDIENVRDAMQKFSVTHPIVLDNDYATWRSYENSYWPRRYLVDISGNIIYDHIGEGAYEETEAKIQEALTERARVLGISVPDFSAHDMPVPPEVTIRARTPEIYFGSLRNDRFLANGAGGISGVRSFSLPEALKENALYLSGTWDVREEYARGGVGAEIALRFDAKKVFMVASGANARISISIDGVVSNRVQVNDEGLYTLYTGGSAEKHTIQIAVEEGSLDAYTFTFE